MALRDNWSATTCRCATGSSTTPTFTLDKSFDTHRPIGRWITTNDEIGDPHALDMRLTLDGAEKQRTSTGDRIYDIYDQIAYLTGTMTLEPGDIFATRMPSGAGLVTGDCMKVGEVVRIEVTGLTHVKTGSSVKPDRPC